MSLLKVECYAGYKPDERPLRFSRCDSRPTAAGAPAQDGPSFEVEEILDQSYGPGYQCFKVRADDQHVYVLRHEMQEDIWTLDSFQRGPA